MPRLCQDVSEIDRTSLQPMHQPLSICRDHKNSQTESPEMTRENEYFNCSNMRFIGIGINDVWIVCKPTGREKGERDIHQPLPEI